MNLIQCFQKNCDWYKNGYTNSKPVGVLWHDTACGNPMLKRYVQPMESDENYDEMIALLGYNKYKNDWNHKESGCGLNAWIGKLADGSIATIQTGEWNKTPWGCGTGKLGSCNGTIIVDGVRTYWGKHFIQFEICDEGYKSKEYWDKVYKEACELTAYLCKEFDIDPFGTVDWNGVTVPTILCHYDSYYLKLGSNHSDIRKWQKAMGLPQNMEQIRKDVAAIMSMEQNPNNEYEVYTKINLYVSSGDAKAQQNIRGTVSPGIYYRHSAFPNGYKGMECLCKDPAGKKDIGWINPIENTKPEEEEKEEILVAPPVMEDPVVEAPPAVEELVTPPIIEAADAPSVEAIKPDTAEPEPTMENKKSIGEIIINAFKSFFSWIISLFKNGNK